MLLGVAALAAADCRQERALPSPPPTLRNELAPAPPQPSAFAWRLTGASSAHRALVLEVETTRPVEGMMIAQQLVPLYQDRFDEVLVYVFEPDVRPRLATLRVQWTRTHGYRMLMLRPVR